jgi:hypothetical protein
MTTTVDLTASVDAWLTAYGNPDAEARAAAIARHWAPEGELVDPPVSGSGHAGVAEVAAAVQGRFPGHTFHRTTAVDAHHDVARYGWELRGPDGTAVLSGLDVVVLADDGRFRRVAGFFGDLE